MTPGQRTERIVALRSQTLLQPHHVLGSRPARDTAQVDDEAGAFENRVVVGSTRSGENATWKSRRGVEPVKARTLRRYDVLNVTSAPLLVPAAFVAEIL